MWYFTYYVKLQCATGKTAFDAALDHPGNTAILCVVIPPPETPPEFSSTAGAVLGRKPKRQTRDMLADA
jgi:hypothetical protein